MFDANLKSCSAIYHYHLAIDKGHHWRRIKWIIVNVKQQLNSKNVYY